MERDGLFWDATDDTCEDCGGPTLGLYKRLPNPEDADDFEDLQLAERCPACDWTEHFPQCDVTYDQAAAEALPVTPQ